jgi:peptidoglycan/xylan/chitin deacetylase (PgdA/CDA1 family)
MTGTVILSFDCEGKWGVADKLGSPYAQRLTDESIRWSYDVIAETLAKYDLRATFAFVGLFVETPNVQSKRVRELGADWRYLKDAGDALAARAEGWSAPWTLDLMSARHEIAFHGYTHTPWTDLTKAQADFELSAVPAAHRSTVIFPRNEVAHLDALDQAGCLGYRAARPARSRVASLASEFWIATKSDPADPGVERLKVIPAGQFINWMSGPRRLVPTALTRLRARQIIAHAAATNGVAHFWTHPENIASNPPTLANLIAIVEECVRARDAGKIRVVDQEQWCRANERQKIA